MGKTLLIIPAYNEEQNIEKVITSINELEINELDVLVVNDGSKDCTLEILKSLKISYVSHPYNLGYGAALQTGFKYALKKNYEYVIQFDADGQHDINNILNIMNELHTNKFDIVIGSRFISEKMYNVGILKKIALSFFRMLIKLTTGNEIKDPTSGLKGLNHRTYKYYSTMGNYPGDYPDADIIIRMLRFKYRIKEIPAVMHYRENGESMHSGLKPIYYFIKVFLSIIIVVLREKFTEKGSCENELIS